MSQIIEIGSEKHNEHLIGVKRDKIISDNQEKIAALKKTLKDEKLKEKPDAKVIAETEQKIFELENPKVELKDVQPKKVEHETEETEETKKDK